MATAQKNRGRGRPKRPGRKDAYTSIRMPRSMLRWVQGEADVEDTSVSRFIRGLVSAERERRASISSAGSECAR